MQLYSSGQLGGPGEAKPHGLEKKERMKNSNSFFPLEGGGGACQMPLGERKGTVMNSGSAAMRGEKKRKGGGGSSLQRKKDHHVANSFSVPAVREKDEKEREGERGGITPPFISEGRRRSGSLCI